MPCSGIPPAVQSRESTDQRVACMKQPRRFLRLTVACVAATLLAAAGLAQDGKDRDARPKLVLQARPHVSLSPSRVILTAELVGGANDFEEYYCPTIEWDWGDDTSSESTSDCTSYEAGKSQIKRRFTVERIYRHAGVYRVSFRLKRHDKSLASANTTVEVRPGVRDGG